MPKLAADSVHILEGKATLYKREGSPLWQVRYRANNKKCRASTQEVDLDKAKKAAVDLVTNAWFRVQNNLPIVNKRFKAVAEQAIKRMDDLPDGVRGKATFRSYTLALKNYFIPYMGAYNIDKVDQALLEKFANWRHEKMKHAPSASTLNTHNSALNRVFDEALLHGYLNKAQVPVIKNQGAQATRRPDITEEEWKTLYKGMRKWVKDARQGHEAQLRGILQNYILILGNTGIRPGTEAMNLKWQHIGLITHNKKTYLTLNVKGKTGEREIQVRHSVARYLQRIQEMDPAIKDLTFYELLEAKSPRYVFRVDEKDMSTPYGRMFGRLLESLKLKTDPRTETERTLYSIRHYFATRALTRTDITPYQLADHMGTSVQMINQYYGHLDLRNVAHKFAGAGSVHASLLHPDEPEEQEEIEAPAAPAKKKGRPKKSAPSKTSSKKSA